MLGLQRLPDRRHVDDQLISTLPSHRSCRKAIHQPEPSQQTKSSSLAQKRSAGQPSFLLRYLLFPDVAFPGLVNAVYFSFLVFFLITFFAPLFFCIFLETLNDILLFTISIAGSIETTGTLFSCILLREL
jgi:hypothetical protein